MATPFRQAVESVTRRGLMPTSLGSAQLEALETSVRARAFFSARVTQTEILAFLQGEIARLVAGVQPGPGQYTNYATIRRDAKALLDLIDYQPAGEPGTIQDLRTNARLNLVIRTQEQMATGYGQRLQSIDPDTIDLWPAWELVRVEDRVEKRNWLERWRAAGGTVYPGSSTGMPLQPGLSEGRLIALKSDGIWARISRFGHPHPPFDFNSGVGVEDVERETTDALGITQPDSRIAAPAPDEFEPGTAQVADLPSEFQGALSEEYDLIEGTLEAN